MRRIWGPLAIAIALASMTAGGVVIVQDGGDEAGAANLLINGSAGSCTRSASPISLATAVSNGWTCGSMDAANDVAQNGDTILMDGGTYGAQSITGSNSRSSMATISVVDGETVTLTGSIGIQGAAWITVNGGGTLHGENARIVTGDAGGTGSPGGVAETENQASGTIGDSDNVALIGIDFGGWAVEDSTNATVKWNDIGPCHSSDGSGTNAGSPNCDNGSIEYCESGLGTCRGYNTGHLIEGNYLHDFGCDQNFYNGSGSDDCHWECMYVSYAKDTTIRNNVFVNCANGGNLFNTFSNGDGMPPWPADYGYTNYLIENNVFTSSCNNSSAPCGGRTGEASGVGHCGIYSGDDFTNTIIRFNTFIDANFGLPCYGGFGTQGGFIDTSADFQFIGNVSDFPGSAETCGNDWDDHTGGAPMTVNYNIYYTGTFTCGTNGANVGASITGMIVANSLTAPDAHLTGASNTLDEFVPASLCPATDFEGDARDTSSGSCDAGADER